MKRILIVEDEVAIREFEAITLTVSATQRLRLARAKRHSIYLITI